MCCMGKLWKSRIRRLGYMRWGRTAGWWRRYVTHHGGFAREKYDELHGRFRELYLQPQVTLDKAPRRQVLPKA
jgi:hypothetical protein